MSNLKVLYASDNRLKNIEKVTTIKNLESLKIDYNRITELPNLKSLPKLNFVRFGYNFISSGSDVVKTKLPISEFSKWFIEDMEHQNLEYAMEYIEPFRIEQVNCSTEKISGRIYMPAEKVQMTIEERISGEDTLTTYIYADVGEDGTFVFDNLDLKKYSGKKSDFKIGICYEYDTEHGYYYDSSLHWYPMK